MNKFWYKAAVLAIVAGSMTACDDDDEVDNFTTCPTETFGAYVLNTGNWGGNDASIQYIDLATGTISSDLYAAANGEGLGDLGQDLCLYGNKLYATVSGSAKFVVMDKNCKVLKSIALTDASGEPVKPRYMTAVGGYVYFTTYEGYVNKLDTASLEIVGKVEVGSYPEGITNANGKLYVNNSGYGKGNTVSVVDIKSFTKTKDIEIVLNPYTQCKTGYDGYVYVVSNGNYAGKPSLSEDQYIYGTLQRIDPTTDTVTELCHASYIALDSNNAYILYSEYYLPDLARAYKYDLSTGAESDLFDLSTLSSPNSIDIDPVNNLLYVTNAPYGSNSDIIVYDTKGNKVKSYEAGHSTSKILFVTDAATK
jgi:hypothetical protein